MPVLSMILCFVFLPSLAAQLHSPVEVNIDGRGELVKEKPLVRGVRSGKQTAVETDPNTRIAAIFDDGTTKVTHDKVGHEEPAKVARKQRPKVEALLEKEDITTASLIAETQGVEGAVPTVESSDNKKFSWGYDEDEGDADTALDELESLTIAVSLKNKNDPPPEDCFWNTWTRRGDCKGGSSCECSCTGEQEYTRTKVPERFGGRPCTESSTKTEVCNMPTCQPTPAPTSSPTAAVTTTLAFATRTGSINFVSLLGLFAAVLCNMH